MRSKRFTTTWYRYSTRSLASAIRTVAGRLPAIRERCLSEALEFAWPSVARGYVEFYGSVPKGGIR